MDDCIFCKIIDGHIPADIIYQDEKAIVFRDIRPKAKVHLLIVSRAHIENLTYTEAQHNELLGHMLSLQTKLAKMEGLTTGFRTVINTGRGGGQEVDHLHFHLLGGGMLPKF